MIDFEFFEHGGVMRTAEVAKVATGYVATLADDPSVRSEAADRATAIALLKQQLAAAGGAPTQPVAAAPPRRPARPNCCQIARLDPELGGQLVTKHFEGGTVDELVLDFDALPAQLDVELRLARMARWVLEVAAAPPRRPARPTVRLGRPGHVLVVDDNPTTIQVAMMVCQLCGHASVGARDGEEAWQALNAGPVDLVLTDLHMPGVGGLALVRALRTHRPELPIIAVTAAGPNGVRALEQLGVDDVVRKPFAVQQLAEAIGKLIVPA